MEYNASKFPDDVARLFKPPPPLKFLKNIDYPISQRRTNPYIAGLTQIQHNKQITSIFNEYETQFPKGSENKHLELQEQAEKQKINELAALESKLAAWDPNNDPNLSNTDPYKTIFVGRLPYDIDEIGLRKIFIKYGQIEKIRIVRDSHGKKNASVKSTLGKSRGYGFVVFENSLSSKMAFKDIGTHKGIEVNGRICIVDIERGRTVRYFKPRRLGGGLGGRGYTGRQRRHNDLYHTRTRDIAVPHWHGTNSVNNKHPPTITRSRYNSSTTSNIATEPIQTPSTSYLSRSSRSSNTTTQEKEEIEY